MYPRVKDPVQLRKKRKKHKIYDKVVKKRSKKSESESKSLSCEDCVDLEFSTAYSLWKHNRIVHSNQEDPDTSTQSYSKFINEYKKSNKVLCSYCGLSFRSDSVKVSHYFILLRTRYNLIFDKYLQKHILTMHFKQKNFMCDYCGKGFLVKQVMKEHMFR